MIDEQLGAFSISYYRAMTPLTMAVNKSSGKNAQLVSKTAELQTGGRVKAEISWYAHSLKGYLRKINEEKCKPRRVECAKLIL